VVSLPRRETPFTTMALPPFMAAAAGLVLLVHQPGAVACVNIVKALSPIDTVTEDCSFIG
jgi:hypothetical protein